MFSPKADLRTYPEWADLPTELLGIIANHVTSIHDYISFRGVCKSWRSPPRSTTSTGHFLGFLGSYFPQTAGRRYLSCSGWILNVSGVNVHLTHPVWRIRIKLPSTHTLSVNGSYGNSISKMVLSNSPTVKADLEVMVIWGKDNQLGFSRPGDDSWTIIASLGNSFSDIIFHNDRLYAFDVKNRRIVECDIHGPNPTQIRQVFSLPSFDPDFSVAARRHMWYLVGTYGKFLIVAHHFGTSSCKIFEIDLKGGSHKEVDYLGNKALFLGHNSSFCFELSTWDEIKHNCIYFSDMNVYCLLDKSFNSFVYGSTAASIPPPVTWVMPSF
ncbi:hypothetical protein BUALT_Bualt10G0050400 [Buddleja alternifolia]|uniref:F-box protein n=1 Tax=Buddleja alternifolia TaxID=168488 RepID=A0AAV6WXX7_9LAMI|nr:hypothetical protein BUALT_Bualt10G0050400 [Buddleja alternifolia]